jgi:myo-inositol-1(or 4)-monophosphatase
LDGLLAQEERPEFSDLTVIAMEAALLAGDILREGFGTHFKIQSKEGHHNLVTEYDLKAEKAIIEFLSRLVPESHFLAEESGQTGTSKDCITWIIDPLDGTVNFAHQIPIFAVSIGVEKDGVIIAGVVLQPMTGELFMAELGKGAYLNGKKLSVTKTKTLSESILATGFPYNLAQNPSHCIEHFVDILKAGIPIRRLGAAAIDLAYTAAGHFDGYFEVALCPWDCAAGKLILEEAGGKMTTWQGDPFTIRSGHTILATNGAIHQEAVTLLSRSTWN